VADRLRRRNRKAILLEVTDRDDDTISAAELLRRMNLPSSELFQESVRAWYRQLPDMPLSALLAFAYLGVPARLLGVAALLWSRSVCPTPDAVLPSGHLRSDAASVVEL
jgi:hypothetical protein